ncbi:hypothetical protein ACM25P_01465 [Vreelandella alkaliphila]|uniref:hypothetical protein n=1 Tax=Vreelandella alkaliphila TaxID=272774 RepID=UPI00258FACE0|nr:hypothetical protein [Halomonas sp.]MCD6438190.1 hypothetical protein [Halomonas sp.]
MAVGYHWYRITLSASQTAQLTNDIVWLVTQTVQLPDGSTTTALMPKVYLAPREGDLATNGELLGGQNGTLISARDIDLALSGDLDNSGTIAERNMVDINAQNLNNSGRIQGDIALIDARQDINIDGGSIAATTGMALQAGGDINIASTLPPPTRSMVIASAYKASTGWPGCTSVVRRATCWPARAVRSTSPMPSSSVN